VMLGTSDTTRRTLRRTSDRVTGKGVLPDYGPRSRVLLVSPAWHGSRTAGGWVRPAL